MTLSATTRWRAAMRTYGWATFCLVLAAGGCGDDTTIVTGPTSVPGADLAVASGDMSAVAGADMATAAPTVVEVTTTDGLMFSPSSVTIRVGGTVRWRNTGSVVHTVTSGASSMASSNPGALFDHNPLAPGGIFEFTFTAAGTQPYFCRFHEAMGMKGTVVVTP
jgi:plastocyanin